MDTMHGLKKKGVKGNYVPGRNLHLTLAFIGETDDPGAVKEALKNVTFKPFKLTLSNLGNFNDLIFAGMKGSQALSALAGSVRDALDKADIKYDRKKFLPHITIIRRASGRWKEVPPPRGNMIVKKISLMKTTFKDGKPVYTEVGLD